LWEETGIPGENTRGRAGDDLTFPHTTPTNYIPFVHVVPSTLFEINNIIARIM